MTETLPPRVLVLVRDLIFATKITGTARVLRIPTQLLRDPLTLASLRAPSLIVDLNLDGAIAAASDWKRATGGWVIGFVSHVDADTIHAARDAGLDRVLARSQFVNLLPQLLAGEPDPVETSRE